MRKFIILLALAAFLSGCASYKFHRGQAPYEKGYVASRDDYTIVEYTLGRNNSVPGLKTAKERFKRRRDMVEHYYKQMGLIENRFRQIVVDPPVMFVQLVFGVFRLPFIGVSEFKYEHNPEYRKRVDNIEDEKEAKEEARIKSLKDKLNIYIQKDLQKEGISSEQESALLKLDLPEEDAEAVPPEVQTAPQEPIPPVSEEVVPPVSSPLPEVVPEPKVEKPVPLQQKVVIPEEAAAPEPEEEIQEPQQPLVQEEIKAEESRPVQGITAVIVAKPQKGVSPLKVQLYGNKSHSLHGRIVSYEWDFGDGDKSTKENPRNTYYSATYGSRFYAVSLTVKDIKGNTASVTSIIEVETK